MSGEILGGKLLTLHNLHFLIKLTENIRNAINEDRFGDFYKEFISNYDWNKKI